MTDPNGQPLTRGPSVIRSEAEGLAGTLSVVVGGERRSVPVLRIKHSRVWKEQALARVAQTDIEDTTDVQAFMLTLAAVATDMILDAVLAYDRTGVLGGRDWLEDNATDQELWAALEGMVAATFPFAGAEPLRSAVAEYGAAIKGLITLRLAEYGVKLARAISTPGSSSEAGTPPETSMTPSPTSSSSSSGPTDSDATSGQPATALN